MTVNSRAIWRVAIRDASSNSYTLGGGGLIRLVISSKPCDTSLMPRPIVTSIPRDQDRDETTQQ